MNILLVFPLNPYYVTNNYCVVLSRDYIVFNAFILVLLPSSASCGRVPKKTISYSGMTMATFWFNWEINFTKCRLVSWGTIFGYFGFGSLLGRVSGLTSDVITSGRGKCSHPRPDFPIYWINSLCSCGNRVIPGSYFTDGNVKGILVFSFVCLSFPPQNISFYDHEILFWAGYFLPRIKLLSWTVIAIRGVRIFCFCFYLSYSSWSARLYT